MGISRRQFLVRTPPVLAAVGLGACTADVGRDDGRSKGSARGRNDMAEADAAAARYDAFACSAVPAAYVLELGSTDASALRDALGAAGFEVKSLPLDGSADLLHGLLVVPAYASDDPEYADYMQQHAADLYTFVDGANVLLELAQAPASEPSPPFLPTTHTARREEREIDVVRALDPEHPLIAGMALDDDGTMLRAPGLAHSAFVSQDGFEVILADESGQLPVLMEGAYGQGRLLLSALAFDGGDGAQGDAGADLGGMRDLFFANLLRHVQDVCGRAAPELSLPTSEAAKRFTAGSSMLAALPDTQVYSLRLPGLYDAQTSWLRNNARKLDIRYALQLGDITNNNTEQEWERASASMSLLSGVVPLALMPGNHDYGPSGDASERETKLNDYFSFDAFAAMPSFGGAYEDGRLENTFHLFSIGGRDFILIALEWGPRDEVIAWADGVMSAHADREGILATHAYLNNDSRRYDYTDMEHSQRFNPHEYATPGGVNDGEQLWQKLVKNHRFAMTLNGHVLGSGVGYLASQTELGNTCHQMLSNYQMRDQGGEGYLRLLEFLPDGKTVKVHTYSPLYDKFLDDPGQNFTIELDALG